MSEPIEKESEFLSEAEDTSKKPPVKKKFNTELSFLLDLLLNEKLSKTVKEKITERVREVEILMVARPLPSIQMPQGPMNFHPTAGNMPPPPPGPQNVANGAAVQQALQERQRLLSQGEKPEPGKTGPRKF